MNRKLLKLGIVIFLMFALFGCNSKGKFIGITVQNSINETRTNETIEIEWKDIASLLKSKNVDGLQIVDEQTNKNVVHQLLDYDQDGTIDQLIFQSDFEPNESKTFNLVENGMQNENKPKQKVYGRFVPERKDDFAWENDRIAFRMYGPALQPTGTVNSGIDVWTKSVNYPVINKWYGDKEKSYHQDHGEGLDYYHVGNTRGCGGLGIWDDGELYTSSTYESWKVVSEGSVRFVFELTYAQWDLKDSKISEVKRISIDAGQNLTCFESSFSLDNDKSEMTYAVGLAIHEKQGTGDYTEDKKNGVFSFWEPATEGNGNLGTAIVIDPAGIQDAFSTADHHYVISKMKSNNKAKYYVGAGWDKSLEKYTSESWNAYLINFAKCLANPVKITITAK